MASPHAALCAWVRWREAERAAHEAHARAEAAYRRYQDAHRALAGDDVLAAVQLVAAAEREERAEVDRG